MLTPFAFASAQEPVNVEVKVEMPVPIVDVAGIVTVVTEASTTPTTTPELIFEDVTEVEVSPWDSILFAAETKSGELWQVVDATIDPTTLVAGDKVSVSMVKEGSLFGFIKIQMELTAMVDTDGNISGIKKPWYAMFAW